MHPISKPASRVRRWLTPLGAGAVEGCANRRILVDQPALLQAVEYVPPAGESEKLAQERVIDRLAVKIVTMMYEDW